MVGQSHAMPLPADGVAGRRFEAQARRMGLDPRDRWVGGYVEYEWAKLRPLLGAYGIDLRGQRVLEFGCNFGASSIVAAFLGASVDGVDVSADAVSLARHNVARYRLPNVALHHVRDTRHLPFRDGEFDFILCNSVLEYVRPEELGRIVAELHRVLKPGGRLFITGTSSRLAPKEVHSGRWLVNYLPRRVDSWLGRSFQRGLDPLALRRYLKGRFRDEDRQDRADRWLAARAATGRAGQAPLPFRAVAMLGRVLGIGPGWLTPNISVMLRRA